MCRTITPGNIESLKKNYSLMNLLEQLEQESKNRKIPLCAECGESSTVFCDDCDMPLCDTHNQTVHLLKVFSSHKRIDISKKPIRSNKCHIHSEPLKLFCEECQSSVCILCRDYGKHKGHDISLISDLFDRYQTDLQKNIEVTKTTVESIDNQLRDLNTYIENLKAQSTITGREIDTFFDDLVTACQLKRESLKVQTEQLISEELEYINIERERMLTLSAEGHTLVNELQSMLGLDLSILSKKDMNEYDCRKKRLNTTIRKLSGYINEFQWRDFSNNRIR